MSTTPIPPAINDELAQALTATLNIAIPAFSQVAMTAFLGFVQNLITHHAGPAVAALKPADQPNVAPILPPPNPAPIIP